MSSKKISDSRICSNIKSLKSYSVPQIDCRIKLDGNESPYDFYTEFKEHIIKNFGEIKLNRYPDPNVSDIKSKLSALYSIPENSILLGNGSDEIIQMLVAVFSGKSGKILIPNPTFSMYKITGIALNKVVIESELDKSFDLDIDDIKEKILIHDPDLLFLATPNNPTANSFTESKIMEIVELTDAITVIDEAYFDYSKKSYMPYLSKYSNLMVLRTMSKIGFASLRLGILIGRSDLIEQVNKVRLPYNINTVSQHIIRLALDNMGLIKSRVEEIVTERKKLKTVLSGFSEIEIFPSDANFFLLRVKDANYLFNELVKRDILIRKFNGSGRLKDCVRITVGTPTENLELVEALKGIFSD